MACSRLIPEPMCAFRRMLAGSRYLLENYRGIGYELIVADTPGAARATYVNDNLFVWTIKREAVKILRPRLA